MEVFWMNAAARASIYQQVVQSKQILGCPSQILFDDPLLQLTVNYHDLCLYAFPRFRRHLASAKWHANDISCALQTFDAATA